MPIDLLILTCLLLLFFYDPIWFNNFHKQENTISKLCLSLRFFKKKEKMSRVYCRLKSTN